MEGIQTFKGSWPWPWIRSYGIPSCITHRPLPIYQISLKSKKLFVDGRSDGHFSPSNTIRSTFGSRPKKKLYKQWMKIICHHCSKCLFDCLVFIGTFSTNRLYHRYEVYHIELGTIQTCHSIKQLKNTINQDNQTLFGMGLWRRSPRHG